MSRIPVRRLSHSSVAAPRREPAPRPPASATPRGRVLGNGRYRLLLTSSGTGGAWLDAEALTAWRGDRVEDEDGWFVYLRDLADGAVWSLGARPVPAEAEADRVEDAPGAMAIARHEHGIDARMEVWVDPEGPVECRRITLHNRTGRPRTLDLTSYLEVVLHDPRHHADHPAFSKLFVQTEYLPEREALLARRRPRAAGERHPWLAQAMRGRGRLSHETDRGRFLGRGRGPAAPGAMHSSAPLSGATGDVLDPAFVLRRVVELAPGATARLELTLAAGASREEALAGCDRLAARGAFEASRAGGERAAARRHAEHGLSAAEASGLERLAAAMLYGDPALRTAAGATGPPGPAPAREGGPAFPASRPLVVVAAGSPPALRRAARTAHAYWRAIGLPTTLIVLVHGDGEDDAPDPESGVQVVAAGGLDAGTLARLRRDADLVVDDRFPAAGPAAAESDGRLADAVASAGSDVTRPAGERARRDRGVPPGSPEDAAAWPLGDEPLRRFNGWGGFSARGDEYVIRMPRDASGAPRLTPRPWINVLANPGFGAIVSESGAGCTWSRNSREFRLTPWSNDPVRDPHDEALYLRDETSGRLWSAFPGPVPGDGPYEMRHGFGRSRCRHLGDGLEVTTDVFVHATDPVKVVELSVTNRGPRPRRLSVTAYQRLAMGRPAGRAAREVVTWADDARGILFARVPGSVDFADAVAFSAAVVPAGAGPVRMGADREQVLGPGGSPARPAALRSGAGPDGRTGAGLEPCFCQQVGLDLAPGETRVCAFLLGECAAVETIEALVGRLRRPGAVAAAREEVASMWAARLGGIRVETPVEALDLLANGWLAYQTLACRLWARTAFYQSGGAFGFRDQLQDAAALILHDPAHAREQILLHCAHQFVEGDVLHWWHPPHERGIRTRFADDLLWLPLVTAAYVRMTGDARVLDERVPFLEGPALAAGEDEAMMTPAASAESADVYEHCGRAIDRALRTGAHGLPLFGSGDWNDGMNRVGREGRGESVWMGFFLFTVIGDFVPLCERRGDAARAERLRTHQASLREALERDGWDGEWYRRGWYDDGAPLGSRASDECRIDALVQAWATLSGAAPPARAARAMDAVERELIAPADGLIRLLTPPFDRTPRDPGYIKGYVPGVRENGGQYTHAALWVIAAMARLGRREPAARLLEQLSPVTRSGSPDLAARYQVEPYVVAADVYDNPAHRGLGGWTWYTGSAGWMLRVLMESLLGVSVEAGDTLVVRPAIPAGWPGFRAWLRPLGRAGTWEVEVRRASPDAGAVVGITLDGRTLAPQAGVARVPLTDDGVAHRVEIVLG